MKILVTGSAGFIGFHIVNKLISKSHEVVGIDNINDYYNIELKHLRLRDSGIDTEKIEYGEISQSHLNCNYKFLKLDICDKQRLEQLFEDEKFDLVLNLAGQAGVRYSLKEPKEYLDSNVIGFYNVLNLSHIYGIKQFLYASSSSVYGNNKEVPFVETSNTNDICSIYAVTKKTNELLAHTFSSLYNIGTVGLRLFTVYGPYGRPDMSPIKFMRAIRNGENIKVYNHGELYRDFTYIDDVVEAICKIIESNDDNKSDVIYNIGNSSPVQLSNFIGIIETVMNKSAHKEMLGMQLGDVYATYADISSFKNHYGDFDHTPLFEGLKTLYDWYLTVDDKLFDFNK